MGKFTIESGHLYGDEIRNGGEFPKKLPGQQTPPDVRLKIETEERDDFGYAARMGKQGIVFGIGKGRQIEKAQVVTELARQFGVTQGVLGFPANPGYANDASPPLAFVLANRFRSKLEYRTQQSVLRFSDGELRGVYAHGQPAGTGIQIITRKTSLAAFVQFAIGGKGQRVRGDDDPIAKRIGNHWIRQGQIGGHVQNFPSRASNLVGLPKVG